MARPATPPRNQSRPYPATPRQRAEGVRNILNNAAMEVLERRECMSASITSADGVLTLRADNATPSHLFVGLSPNGKTLEAHVTGMDVQRFSAAGVTSIELYGSTGDDRVAVSDAVKLPCKLDGGEGNNVILGSGGNDTITAGDGNNVINGRAGNDTITVGKGKNVVDGGAGNDTITVGAGQNMVAGGKGNDTVNVGSGKNLVLGGPGNDTVVAVSGVNTVRDLKGKNNIVRGAKTHVRTNHKSHVVSEPAPQVGEGNGTPTGGTTSGSTSTGDTTSSGTTTGGTTSGDGASGHQPTEGTTSGGTSTGGTTTGGTKKHGHKKVGKPSGGTAGGTPTVGSDPGGTTTGGNTSGSTTDGGTTDGGTTTGGDTTGVDTSGGTTDGGTTIGGTTTGGTTTGGTTTGGTTTGGTTDGGTTTGGTKDGGTTTGGTTDGGTTTGGTTTGGTTDGTTTGGTTNGGTTTGGTTSGGTTNGGTTTGGTTTGGTTTGGTTTGGTTTGGTTTGGTTTGGTTTGGTTAGNTAWATQTTLGSVDPGPISFAASSTQANIQALESTGMATHTVHFNGLASHLKTGDALDATYSWDFGDPGSRFNTLVGWNAAHTYDTPGTYTATLTVTDSAGNKSVATSSVTINADTRHKIYVDSVAGSDTNTGLTPASAVASVARAAQLITNDSEVLFHNGQSFNVVNSTAIVSSNLLLTTYGTGDPARIVKVRGTGSSIFNIGAGAKNVTAQGLVLDSMWDMATYGTNKVNVYGFYVTGDNFTVRDCKFMNIDDGVNTAGEPTGVLVQDNYFANTIRGCCIWGQGYDHVYIGNTMTDSTKEHLIRMSGTGVTRVLIENNNLSRPSNMKGSLELRTASFFYVRGNTVNGGTLRIGLPDGIDPNWTGWGVVENNETYKIFTNIRPGVQHVVLRNNVFNSGPGAEIVLETQGSLGNREIADIRIDHNTLIDDAQYCSFLKVDGVTKDVSVTNNLMIAPNIQWKGAASGGIYAAVNDLSGFSQVSNNIWPGIPATATQPGVNYLYPTFQDNVHGFKTNAEWASLPQVHNEQYSNAPVAANVYDMTLGGITAGALPTAFDPSAWGLAVAA